MTNQFEWENSGEFEGNYETFESLETLGESQGEYGEQESGAVFNETQEMELAAELLGVSNEQELQQFIGGLIKRAGQAVGTFVKSPTGQALGGILKNAAKQALPVVGGAIGSAIGGSTGGSVGRQVASAAGRIFGLELEGLSAEDQEFEAARRYVRFAGAATGRAAKAPRHTPPQQVARAAATHAARRFAPGLLRGRPQHPRGFRRPGVAGVNIFSAPPEPIEWPKGNGQPDDNLSGDGIEDTPDSSSASAASGRWLKRGRHILILNAC